MNREDVRKVLEAHSKVINRLKDAGEDIQDVPMKTVYGLVLGELIQENK